ncbi:Outer membrane protein assembly factor BamD [Flavobacterium columnare]|uniref:CDC27 family protein n=2 Tax=Flavobacterium TaxID=237 RepID=A0ABW8PPW3_9FLAO|nr:CDC27 family protein [Flavobacterium columnare]SPE77799.1 Outer membrane protein assembly factor BamD [Flavobacterium columnare]
MKKIILIITFLTGLATSAQNNEKYTNSLTPEQDKLFDKALEKLNSKKYADAIELFNLLIPSLKGQKSPYYYLAQAYFLNKQYSECIETCTKGLVIGPEGNFLNYYRAKANIELGKTDSVCDDIKKSKTQEKELLKYCN